MQVEEKIAVTIAEYKRLIEIGVREKVLEDYVNSEKYSLDKSRVRSIMGFAGAEEDDV